MVPIDNRAKEKEFVEILNQNLGILQYLDFVDLVHHQVILDQLEYLRKEIY